MDASPRNTRVSSISPKRRYHAGITFRGRAYGLPGAMAAPFERGNSPMLSISGGRAVVPAKCTDQAKGNVLFNGAVRRLEVGEALVFMYGYDDKRPDERFGPYSLADLRLPHAASLMPDARMRTKMNAAWEAAKVSVCYECPNLNKFEWGRVKKLRPAVWLTPSGPAHAASEVFQECHRPERAACDIRHRCPCPAERSSKQPRG